MRFGKYSLDDSFFNFVTIVLSTDVLLAELNEISAR